MVDYLARDFFQILILGIKKSALIMHYFWIQEVSLSGDHLTYTTTVIYKDLERDLYIALAEFLITLMEVAKTARLFFMRLTAVFQFFLGINILYPRL